MNNTVQQRHNFIVSRIEKRGSAYVVDLAKDLNVSEMTIRRDLNELEKVGLLRRIHGGAVNARGRGFEPPLSLRMDENRESKALIGRYAADMVAEGDSVALDIGSTTYEIAVNLQSTRNITLITPSIPIASRFFDRSDVRLILPGGIVRSGETSMIGDLARRNLEILYVDRLFLAVGGIDSKAGLTEYNLDDTSIKRIMIKNAMEIVVVADSTKFEKIAFAFIAQLDVINHLITNNEPPQDLLKALKNANTTIHIVSETSVRIL
jgi:DeoR family transcriptional regulator, fructose operon transcriptional repressor